MDEIGRNYLTVALNLDRHFEGFVDAYFGPRGLKAEAEGGEPRPLDALADDARQLQAAIEDSYDPHRKDYLTGQTRAMAAIIRNLDEIHPESPLPLLRLQLCGGRGAVGPTAGGAGRQSQLRPATERALYSNSGARMGRQTGRGK